ncbi:traC domain protein (plasmid) [Salmonella enterica subsp. enterica]|nr:traC domain protein [Salmonella enterica subsp. enterica]
MLSAGFGDAKDQWFSSLYAAHQRYLQFSRRWFCHDRSAERVGQRGDDFEFIRQCREQNMDIHDAVYQLAQRNFLMNARTGSARRLHDY